MNNIKGRSEDVKAYCIAAGFIFLFIGPLLKYKPAYDYVIVKNITGFLFCILLSAAFILKNKVFNFNRHSFRVFLLFAGWILLSALMAPVKHGAAKQLEEYLLYFMIFVCAMNSVIEKKWFYFWLGAGFIASLLAIFQFFGELKYPVSTFGNPNFFAGHIMMLIVISFSAIFSETIEKKERAAFIVFLAAAFTALILVKSRAAIFATFFGISTVMLIVNSKGSFIKKWGFFIFLFAVAVFLFPTIHNWFTTNIRVYLWRGTLAMIKRNPVTGWGLGNFVFFYPYFRIKEYFLQAESTPTTTHAHNEYLHIWSETGILGLFLFIALLAVIVFLLRKSVKKDCFENIVFIGVIGGFAAVLIDNIFSTNLRNPSTAMYFWFLMGLSAGKIKQQETSLDVSKILWYTILLVSLVMCVFTSFYRVLPEVYLKRGIWAKDNGNAGEAIDNYLVVSSINPYNYISRYKLAYVYGETGRLEESKKVYLEIHNGIFPHFAKLDANLGTVYLRQGAYTEALRYYKWEEWFNPYDIDVLCSIASIYFIYYDDVEKGMKYINRVLVRDNANVYANNVIKMLKEEGKIK
ncbi:MAG TPA: O-antigen ligase family protein [bacterium]|nr:O-antigen ligase family protein [bacterium]